MAGGIAHDFNNLLVGVLGNAGLAEKDLPPSSPVRRYLANIAKAAQRAADLTRQLLAYSGKGQFVIKPVSLNEVVRDMADLIEVSLPKRVSLALHLASDLPYVAADSGQIQQVILNLVTNGAEATGGAGGLVAITTGVQHLERDSLTDFSGWHVEPGMFVFVEVTDTGAGISTGILEKIFDPFYTTKATGRGLGLAAVLGIVRGHRGAIHVYTEIGRGSSFKVFFPVTEEAPRLEDPAAPEAGWRGRGTVLVVDDDAEVRTAAALILEYAGFQTRVASDGDEAIRTFRDDPSGIVAILLDMTMPGKCGEETFRALRRVRPDVKVILSSGYNEHEATERFVGRGLAGFIQKPYTPDALISAFRTALTGEPPEPGPG
ncbi:MAG: response regulator [Planctomycetes bacterium]|nr:response regulator [Planctomycetota bacterium]